MESISIIVTAYNKGAVLGRTLQSVEDAVAFFRDQKPGAAPSIEIVVVDDGSTDGTAEILETFTRPKSLYRIIRRAKCSSPSCARNTGVSASNGSLLFFLDGDDLFYPNHLTECCRALQDPRAQFVKTGVRLQDSVHPDWKWRIEGSVVINLCVRRACHIAVGGFPDYHLFTRQGDLFQYSTDIYFKFEDQHYNKLVCSVFPGLGIAGETVEHLRYPGNEFDRQYEKFCRPFGTHPDNLTPERQFQVQLADVITNYQVNQLKARLVRGDGN